MKKLEKLKEKSKLLRIELSDVRKEIEKLEAEEKNNSSQYFVGKYYKMKQCSDEDGTSTVFYVYDVSSKYNEPIAIEYSAYEDDSEYYQIQHFSYLISYLKENQVEECTKAEFDIVRVRCLTRMNDVVSKIK